MCITVIMYWEDHKCSFIYVQIRTEEPGASGGGS